MRIGVFIVPGGEDPQATVEQIVAADRAGLDLVGVQDHPYQRTLPRHLDAALLRRRAHRADHADARRDQPAPAPAGGAGEVGRLARRPERRAGRARARRRRVLGRGCGDGRAAAHAGRVGRRARRGDRADPLLLRGETLRLDGEHYSAAGGSPGPAPAHPIGLWLGAYGPRMLRLTGRLGDGWLPSIGANYMSEADVLASATRRSTRRRSAPTATRRRSYGR